MPKGAGPVVAVIAAVLVALVIADFFVTHHGAFGIDGTPGFAAWFSVLAASAAIALSLGFAALAWRAETSAEQEGRDE